MKFYYLTLSECSQAAGVVVAIDVCRAFTTAAYAFAGGVREITLTRTVEEALALRAANPDWLAMGEVMGKPVSGFDLWNSPSQVMNTDLAGRTLVQRTTAGTQGVLLPEGASYRLAASFAVARATARWIEAMNPPEVNFVITGVRPDGSGGVEDAACANYIADLLRGKDAQPGDYMAWVATALSGLAREMPGRLEQIQADVRCCQAADVFDFAMLAFKQGEQVVLRPVEIDGAS